MKKFFALVDKIENHPLTLGLAFLFVLPLLFINIILGRSFVDFLMNPITWVVWIGCVILSFTFEDKLLPNEDQLFSKKEDSFDV